MSSFTEIIAYRKLKKRHFWHSQCYQILEPFEYHIGTEDSEDVIKVDAGFITDFASTPFWIRWKYPAIGWYAKAAVLHDRGYKYPNGHSKNWWDNLLKESMTVIARSLVGKNIPKEMQLTIDRFYWAVQTIFGKWAWNKHRKS